MLASYRSPPQQRSAQRTDGRTDRAQSRSQQGQLPGQSSCKRELCSPFNSCFLPFVNRPRCPVSVLFMQPTGGRCELKEVLTSSVQFLSDTVQAPCRRLGQCSAVERAGSAAQQRCEVPNFSSKRGVAPAHVAMIKIVGRVDAMRSGTIRPCT